MKYDIQLSQKRKSRRAGQGLTEYLLLVCLLVVGSIVVVTQLGDSIRAQLAIAAQRIAGKTSTIRANEKVEGIEKKTDRKLDDFWKQ